MPPRSQYGSLVPSSAALMGQFSPGVAQYGTAVTPTASPGQIGHVSGYFCLQPSLAHQYQGSPQQPGGMAMFRPPAGMSQGPSQPQGVEAQTLVTSPVTSAPSS